MPRYKCKWSRGSCSKVCLQTSNLQSSRGGYVIPQFIYQVRTGSVLGAGLVCLDPLAVKIWSTSKLQLHSFGDIVMYIERTIQIHTKMKSSYSVLPLSYIINFCIFMSVCCFSNGAYLLVLVIEQILNSYSCRQWSLQLLQFLN